MELTAVKKQIMSGKCDNFYIFTGEEGCIISTYIDKLAEVSKLNIKRVDEISDMFGSLHNNSMLSTKYCYVVRDSKEFQQNDELWDIQNHLNGNMLILIYTKLDSRWKMTKKFADRTVECKHLSEDILMSYIQRNMLLPDDECKQLIDVCEGDLSRIYLELDKIRRISDSPRNAFHKLLADGTIYKPPLDAVFKLVDAILTKQCNKAFEYYDNCVRVGEATLVILSNLYNTARAVLQIQACSSSDISKSTGLTGWQIKCAKDKVGYYSTESLENLLKLVRETEKGIKTGEFDESIVVPYVIINVLQYK